MALVIGNGHYSQVPALTNPENDARDISTALRGLGFEVDTVEDAGRAAMDGAIQRFGQKASGAAVALLFYSGHGVQAEGENYLIPVDFRITAAGDLGTGATRLSAAMQAMSGAANKIVILDACRNNPFVAKLRTLADARSIVPGLAAVSSGRLNSGGRFRAVGSGLAQPSASEAGMLIAFATSPGNVASDGSGRNSPFTAALLQYLASPGIGIQQLLTHVRRAVIAATGGQQTPWENSSLLQDIVLRPGPAPSSAQAGSPSPAGSRQGATFDGVWVAQRRCTGTADHAAFGSNELFEVSNNHVKAVSYTAPGEPGYRFYEGDIDAVGHVSLKGSGVSGGGGLIAAGGAWAFIWNGQFSGDSFSAVDITTRRTTCTIEGHRR